MCLRTLFQPAQALNVLTCVCVCVSVPLPGWRRTCRSAATPSARRSVSPPLLRPYFTWAKESARVLTATCTRPWSTTGGRRPPRLARWRRTAPTWNHHLTAASSLVCVAETVPQGGAHPPGVEGGPGRHLAALLPERHPGGGLHQRGLHGGGYRSETHGWISTRGLVRVGGGGSFPPASVLLQHSDNPLSPARVEDAHQSEERRFLRRGVQLAAEEEAWAGHPSALPGHAHLPGRGGEAAQAAGHPAVAATSRLPTSSFSVVSLLHFSRAGFLQPDFCCCCATKDVFVHEGRTSELPLVRFTVSKNTFSCFCREVQIFRCLIHLIMQMKKKSFFYVLCFLYMC